MRKKSDHLENQTFVIPSNRNSGIYMIYNKSKDGAYIGQTSNLQTRAANHIRSLRKGNHPNVKLQNGYNNGDEMYFIVLLDVGMSYDKGVLLFMEKLYIWYAMCNLKEVYNRESRKQIEEHLVFIFKWPLFKAMGVEFKNKIGCYPASMKYRNKETMSDMVFQSNIPDDSRYENESTKLAINFYNMFYGNYLLVDEAINNPSETA